MAKACPIAFFESLDYRNPASKGECISQQDGYLEFWWFTVKPQSWSEPEFHDRATKYGHHPYQGEPEAIAIEHLGADYVASFLARHGHSSWQDYQDSF